MANDRTNKLQSSSNLLNPRNMRNRNFDAQSPEEDKNKFYNKKLNNGY